MFFRALFSAVVMSSAAAWADSPCKELARGFEKFNNKKSAWVETSEIIIVQCANETRAELFVGGKVLDTKVLQVPGNDQHWTLDGLECNERGGKRSAPRSKVVLIGDDISETFAAWAVNPKTQRFEALELKKLSCKTTPP